MNLPEERLAELRTAAVVRAERMADYPDTVEEQAERADWVDALGWPALERYFESLDLVEVVTERPAW